MLKGFKEFILRGNVIDLAVAVVIGAAFSAVVTALVESIFNPAIGALFNASSLKTLWIVEVPSLSGEPAQIAFGAVVAAVVQFLLVAAVVYFALIVPINYLKKKAFRAPAEPSPVEPAPPTELELLIEIRDLLAAGSRPSDHAKHTD
jgi:large conductance mechanosensitive channel